MPSQSQEAQEDADMSLTTANMRKVPLELKPWYPNYTPESKYKSQSWRVPDAAISTALTLALAGQLSLSVVGPQLPPDDCEQAQGQRRAGLHV